MSVKRVGPGAKRFENLRPGRSCRRGLPQGAGTSCSPAAQPWRQSAWCATAQSCRGCPWASVAAVGDLFLSLSLGVSGAHYLPSHASPCVATEAGHCPNSHPRLLPPPLRCLFPRSHHSGQGAMPRAPPCRRPAVLELSHFQCGGGEWGAQAQPQPGDLPASQCCKCRGVSQGGCWCVIGTADILWRNTSGEKHQGLLVCWSGGPPEGLSWGAGEAKRPQTSVQAE